MFIDYRFYRLLILVKIGFKCYRFGFILLMLRDRIGIYGWRVGVGEGFFNSYKILEWD